MVSFHVFAVLVVCQFVSARTSVQVNGRALLVNGTVFNVKGVCYSPVPIGESPLWTPYGDYFTEDYGYMWRRDLPLIKAMGANTVRLYGWRQELDHTAFLDELTYYGLYAMVTFHVPPSSALNYLNANVREQLITNFTNQVRYYGDHDAIILWSFGNDLNSPWYGLLDAFNQLGNCGWDMDTCWNQQYLTSQCKSASRCVYEGLLGLIDTACAQAREISGRPCTSTLIDADHLVEDDAAYSRISMYEDVVPNMDMWSVKLYRGRTFGSYFEHFGNSSQKPLIIAEYGVDGYNDPCGWTENYNEPCFNSVRDGTGGDVAPDSGTFIGCQENPDGAYDCELPGETAQALWDAGLSAEIMESFSDTEKGNVVGGFLMAWTDERWKGFAVENGCFTQQCKPNDVASCDKNDYQQDGIAGCTAHAHWSCPNANATHHGLCGAWTGGTQPDGYTNEEWFGVVKSTKCGLTDRYGGHGADSVDFKEVFTQMTTLWNGCTWKSTTTVENELQCQDGSFCNGASDGWTCCNDRGGRAMCPPNKPLMCAERNKCAEHSDYCCLEDCYTLGGERPCVTTDVCPWEKNTDEDNMLQCNDGSFCSGAFDGWSCCNNKGGRAMCPPNKPIMCAQQNACADGSDYCCYDDCFYLGGARKCSTGGIDPGCPWMVTTNRDNQLQCQDGSLCNGITDGWSCCNDKGGRAMCPPNKPVMCAQQNACAGGSDYCCLDDCFTLGGDRQCDSDVETKTFVPTGDVSQSCDAIEACYTCITAASDNTMLQLSSVQAQRSGNGNPLRGSCARACGLG